MADGIINIKNMKKGRFLVSSRSKRAQGILDETSAKILPLDYTFIFLC